MTPEDKSQRNFLKSNQENKNMEGGTGFNTGPVEEVALSPGGKKKRERKSP